MSLYDQLEALVKRAMWRVDYYAARSASVISQNGDGTLELKFDDPRFAPASKVPYTSGFPGVKITVAAGAKCLVTFENGDPARPRVSSWLEPSLTEVQLSGTRPVARQADTVVCVIPMGTVLPFMPTLMSAAPGTPVTGTFVLAAPVTVSGQIITGSGKVKA